MKRLIERGLMFGNLVEIASPALIERYNRALKHLTGKTTALDDFHIDIAGYSPEVGDELGDHLYLNANGCNRQFILLTTDQKTAPLLHAKFSTSRGILRRFIEENEAQLFTLTAQDVVAGELENTVFDLATPARLFDIGRITVVADTIGNHVAEGAKLTALIERFRSEEDAWWDDVLIAEMIERAKITGDVTRNPITLRSTAYDLKNFWTSHFGGLYLFRGLEHPAVISALPRAKVGALPIKHHHDLGERNAIARFLQANGLTEPIVGAPGADAGAILRQKMDFILVDAAAALGIDAGSGSRRELRQIAARIGGDLPEAFEGLADLLRYAEAGGPWPRITSEHPAYFYTLRARPHADRDLVNMLLAELSPLDVRQLFICHKELFYSLYATWSDPKKDYVADFLAREYALDKAGARRALFGPEPGMDDAAPAHKPEPQRDIVDLVGPWGKVLKGRT